MTEPTVFGLKWIWWMFKDIAKTLSNDWSNYWFRKRAKPLDKPKTTLECLQQYAEKVVIDSGINLENVLVHNQGQFGFAGRSFSFETYTIYNDVRYNFRLPLATTPYIVVPEITGWWEFRAWLHEVGHYKNKHYCEGIKPTYIQEYEAEKYCLDMAMLCPHVDYNMYCDIRQSALNYLGGHIETAIKDGIINCYTDIPDKVIEFFIGSDGAKQIKDWLKQRDEQNLGIYEEIFA